MIAIVGRPNVGKSSLLNCLAGRRISIVDATAGVTRDRVSVPIAVGDGYVELVDTGGMGIEDMDQLTDEVEEQIAFGVKEAELILFVVDARDGVLPLDRHVADKLRKQNKPVVLIANKVDMADLASEVGEMERLGFGTPLAVSATHNKGIPELLDIITEQVAHLAVQQTESVMKLAIVGKRNAGKSTFINALAGEQRVIVSEVPGTTRDSVDVTIEMDGQRFTLIDTAGVLKRKKIKKDIEFYSHHRALRSVRRADVVALMIDASLPISQVDKKFARDIAEEYKPVLLVVNKWDLAREKTTGEDYVEYFEKVLPELRHCPICLTSAIGHDNIHETIRLAKELFDQANHRVSTGLLNSTIEEIVQLRGPSHRRGTKPPKIFYGAQIATAPPTIVLFVNDPKSFDQNWERFFVNQLRERLPYGEVPIRLLLRQRRKTPRKTEPKEE